MERTSERDRDDDDSQRRPDDADEGQRQEEARHGLESVGDAHQHLVDETAGKAGQRADHRADEQGGGSRGQSDRQRGAGAVEEFSQYIAAEPVCAERQGPVLKWWKQRRAGNGLWIAGKEQRCRQRHGEERYQDDRPGDSLGRTQEASDRAHPLASLAPTRGSRKA